MKKTFLLLLPFFMAYCVRHSDNPPKSAKQIDAKSEVFDIPSQPKSGPTPTDTIYKTRTVERPMIWAWDDKSAGFSVTEEHPLTITENMVAQTTGGTKNAWLSFDGKEGTFWFPGWNAFPTTAVVDLDAEYEVTKLRLFDMNGAPQLVVKTGKTATDLTPLENTVVLDAWNTWREVQIHRKAVRYLSFTLTTAQGDRQLPEVQIWVAGDSSPPTPPDPTDTVTPPPPPPPPPPGPSADKYTGAALYFGTNSFPWIPPASLELPWMRTYFSSGWAWRPDGIYPEPLWQAGTPVAPGLDTYLRNMKSAGQRVILCVNQTPEWYRPTGRADNNNDFPPIKPGLSRVDPKNYKDFAEFLWQLSARYGRKVWPVSDLRLAKGPVFGSDWVPENLNPPLSGADLLTHIEGGNEWEKWWKRGSPTEGEQYMEPEEVAALMSACYDGHEGRLGPKVGVKSADPTMKFVMPGLTGFDVPYVMRMDAWFKANRTDKSWPCDALNFHHYSNRLNRAGVWPPTWDNGGGINPEADQDFATVATLVKFAHDRGKLIYVTEFGYDTRRPATDGGIWWAYPQTVPGKSAEQTQADWNLRTFLEYIRFGVDMTAVFNGCDEHNAETGNLYASSGLLYGSGAPIPFAPKPSYHSVRSFVLGLNGASYAADLSTSSYRMLAFRSPTATKLAVWLPTNTNTTARISVGTCQIEVSESPKIIELK